MPHLLSTIVLTNNTHLKLFVGALQIQRRHRLTSSRLTVDYQKYIRRFWFTECCGAVEDSPPEDDIEYGELFGLLRNANVGFNAISIGVLCNIIGSSYYDYSMGDWPAKKRLTMCGLYLRWRPLTATCEGHAFLATITHLTLWVTYKQEGDELHMMQEWVQSVPFELMPNLSHFALLLPQRAGIPSAQMLVYKTEDERPGAEMFREWGLSSDPFKYGAVVPLYVHGKTGEGEDWEGAYLCGEDDLIWQEAGLI